MENNNNKFGIQFKFDCEREPPRVFIADNGGSGTCYVEIFEEPTPKMTFWSNQNDDWAPGVLAKDILNFMNMGTN